MVAVPAATAVTVVAPVVPDAGLTVNTAVLLDTQLTGRPVSVLLLESLSVAVSCCVAPIDIGVVGAETVTVATGARLTVIVGVLALGALSLVAEIVAVPAPTAATVIVAPVEELTELGALTVNTAVLLETQLTVRPESACTFASFGVAVRV
jgi:hypothetical protein